MTLIEGDGIGPEICESVVSIFAAAQVPIEWERVEAGLTSINKTGVGVPQETLDSIKRNKVALKGPTTTPVGGGHKSVNVTIRKALELFANVRLARSMPAVQTRFHNVNILVVRENIEDTYSGIEYFSTPNVAQCLKVITRPGSMAAIRFAFEEARKLGRKRVTCVHKANIHKITDGLFLEVFRQVAAEYTELEATDIIVDNCCMQLVTRPEQFDVLVLPNLYGDIVSDLCAGIVGGLGVAPGGNIGRECAVFEAVHGSAPDIAGKGLANPTAILVSGVQMLQYMGLVAHAGVIEDALVSALADGNKTRDLGGSASTSDFTAAIIERLHPAVEDDIDVPFGAVHAVVAPAVITEPWVLHGADVFMQHDGIPAPPEKIGPFVLRTISNRGTKIWPGPTPNILLVDEFRCRYVGDTAVTRSEITSLLNELAQHGFDWGHVELLHTAGGQPRYSKAQGE